MYTRLNGKGSQLGFECRSDGVKIIVQVVTARGELSEGLSACEARHGSKVTRRHELQDLTQAVDRRP